jgi:hypothetical protein
MRRPLLLTAALLGGLIRASGADAASFCVETTAQLRAALQTAVTNGEDDVIQIKTGTYTATSGSAVAAVTIGGDDALTLRGGYVDVLQFACASVVRDPELTVIDGQNLRQGLELRGTDSSNADLTIENLTFTRGVAERGGGLAAGGSSLYSGDVSINRVYFHENTGEYGGALHGSTRGTYALRNSVFIGNVATSNSAAASLGFVAEQSQTYRVFIGGNTVVGNSCADDADGCNNGGIRIAGSARAVFFNNAFAFNQASDLNLDDVADLFHNQIQERNGVPGVQAGNLALADPGFVSVLTGDVNLNFSSPLRDSGAAQFDLGPFDFAGKPRLNGAQYDIGAFENDDLMFRDGFED